MVLLVNYDQLFQQLHRLPSVKAILASLMIRSPLSHDRLYLYGSCRWQNHMRWRARGWHLHTAVLYPSVIHLSRVDRSATTKWPPDASRSWLSVIRSYRVRGRLSLSLMSFTVATGTPGLTAHCRRAHQPLDIHSRQWHHKPLLDC
jgi:hypothetical protein